MHRNYRVHQLKLHKLAHPKACLHNKRRHQWEDSTKSRPLLMQLENASMQPWRPSTAKTIFFLSGWGAVWERGKHNVRASCLEEQTPFNLSISAAAPSPGRQPVLKAIMPQPPGTSPPALQLSLWQTRPGVGVLCSQQPRCPRGCLSQASQMKTFMSNPTHLRDREWGRGDS